MPRAPGLVKDLWLLSPDVQEDLERPGLEVSVPRLEARRSSARDLSEEASSRPRPLALLALVDSEEDSEEHAMEEWEESAASSRSPLKSKWSARDRFVAESSPLRHLLPSGGCRSRAEPTRRRHGLALDHFLPPLAGKEVSDPTRLGHSVTALVSLAASLCRCV